MKKLKAMVILSILMLMALSTIIGQDLFLLSEAKNISKFEKKIYSKATIEDDFDGTSVLVVLDKSISGINKTHKNEFFGKFKKSKIKELTSLKGNGKNKKYLNTNEFRQIFEITLPINDKQEVLNAIEELEEIEGVLCAEPNYYFSGQTLNNVDTSDLYYLNGAQWALNGTYGINAAEAWEITKGSEEVKVAVIDTGIDSDHPDLIDNIGAGYNFVNNTSNTDDIDGHGTLVAGIIAANSNNIGITGVSPNITLVPYKIADTQDSWAVSNVISAIIAATDNDISIINFSAKCPESIILYKTVKNYTGLVVCPSGNSHVDINPNVSNKFLANSDLENVITVGAINSDGNISSYSGYGLEAVDIFAPGGRAGTKDNPLSVLNGILSTFPLSTCGQTSDICVDNYYNVHYEYGYHIVSGTSEAAPHVTGVAALILSEYPEMTATQIKTAILAGVDKDDRLTDKCVSGGRLNARKALEACVVTEGLEYILSDDESCYSVAKGTAGNNEVITIPSVYNEKPVKYIAENGFKDCINLSNFIFSSDNICENIGASAFEGCVKLKNINLPKSIEIIGNNAFKNCVSLNELIIPSTVTNIGNSILSGCSNLKKLTVPFIGESNLATEENSLLGYFFGTTQFSFTKKTRQYYSQNEYVEYYIPNSLQKITITSAINLNYGAFYNCSNIFEIVLPLNSLGTIGNSAFFGNSGLSYLNIPATVYSIGNNAFFDCNNLIMLSIENENSKVTLGNNVFSNCNKLECINIPYQLIDEYQEDENWGVYQLSSKLVPYSVGLDYIYQEDSLSFYVSGQYYTSEDLYIPTMYNGIAVTGILNNGFENSYFKRVVLSNNINIILDEAFKNCSRLEKIDVPNSIDTISRGAFENCNNLKTVKFAKTNLHPITIGAAAFRNCSSLENIDIPNAVYLIGNATFENCNNLNTVRFIENNLPKVTVGIDAFKNCNRLKNIQLPNNLQEISSGLFSGCESLTNISLPESINSIEEYAFYGCISLESITIPDNVTVGDCAFDDCESLTIYTSEAYNGNNWYGTYNPLKRPVVWECEIAEGTTYVEKITKYTWIQYNNGELNMPYREDYFFDGWKSDLDVVGQRIDIDEIISDTEYYAIWIEPYSIGLDFVLIDELEGYGVCIGDAIIEDGEIIIPETYLDRPIIKINDNGFKNCSELEHINIPTSITIIGENAFYGCAGLESVIITDNVNTIGENAFYGCENLTVYTAKQSIPTGWHSNWNSSGRPVAWGCELSDDGYVLIIGTINIGDGQTISNPYKLGDTFLGWYSSPYFYANSAAEENLLPNTVYYAKWNNLAKSITYDLAGGTGNYTSFSVNSGTQIEEPEHNPTKENMIFQYWAKSTDLTQEYDWESPVTEDITLMAVWEWDATEGLGYILNVDETGYEVSIGEASSTEIIIPNYHNGLPVIGIAENGFRKYTSITSITIPSNVEYIGYGAFEYCDALTSITFEVGSSLTEIDDWAFYSCDNLTSIELPNGLERIGRYAFGETGLISIEIPQSVTEIDDYAFYSCSSLENLTIQSNSELIRIGSDAFFGNGITCLYLPSSVSSISGSSFANNDITDITVNDNNETYSSNGNCIIRNSDNVLILGCNESTIPDNVTSIGEYAFAYCDFISIAIPNTVVSIASYAFLGCTNLESIAIPSSVTSIGEDVFLWCSSLASINVDESNTVYSSEAGVLFNNTKTILIKYPTGKAGAYTVLNGVIEIGENAFSYCAGLMSITIPSCVTTINNNAFRNCTTLTSITFEEGSLLNYIGNNAFWNCYAMECTTFGNNTVLSYIGSSSFEGCNGITSMTIPASITYIGSYAFSGWIETQTITFLTDISVIEDFDVDFLSYCNAVIDWESYLELETYGLEYTSVTYIGIDGNENEAYEVSIGTATSTTIVIPSMYNGSPVIRIAEDGFEGSEIVKVIIIGTNLKRIGESAFAGCEELIEINVPHSVEEIGSYAFSGCTNLTHINLPMEMDILDVGVFANSGIKSITMPSEVAIISPSALSGAYGYTIYTQDSYTQATWKGQFMTKDCVIFFETEIEYDNGAYVKSILIHVRNRMQAIPTEPYREGYEFVGWTTTEGSEAAEYTMEDLISIDLINGTRLYAVWQEIT